MPLEPRPQPIETVDGLRPPLEGFPYFTHADIYPFEPTAEPGSALNAWWLADASFLVYGDATFIETAIQNSPLPSQGYTLDWLGSPADNRGMVLSNNSSLIIIFRGTRLNIHSLFDVAEFVTINQNDLWTDTRFFPAAWKAGGKVHSGFLQAFSEIRHTLDRVSQARRTGQRLWLTGHSLGGALATLSAAHLRFDTVHAVTTFGAPRVGDSAFTSTIPSDRLARYVHRDDWVATVPPTLLGYAHAGREHILAGEQKRDLWNDFRTGAGELTTALADVARLGKSRVGSLPFKVSGLADHAAIYYATLLWNDLIVSNTNDIDS